MTKLGWLIFAVSVVVISLILIRYARRVDRLHRRVVQAKATLDHALSQRRSLVRSLVEHPDFDSAARQRLASLLDVAEQHPSEANESALSRALREERSAVMEVETVGYGEGNDVSEVSRQLAMARRFHNQEVEQVRRIRARMIVRVFHLAGRAQLPDTYDMDDRY